MRSPNYTGGGLVNLAAEIEYRLRGEAVSLRLDPALSGEIPDAETYVLVLFDGLGDGQLRHRLAAPIRRNRRAALDASFSTQTTVNLSTLATGMPPSQHGLVAYLLRMGGRVVNTIWWFDLTGQPVDVDFDTFLPAPNLPERLSTADVETVVVQPSAYDGNPLSRVLFRGGTALPYDDDGAAVSVTLEAASKPGRLVFLYLPHVDAAAHAEGQGSELYDEMMNLVAERWQQLTDGLPAHAVAIGTADHGHVDATTRIHVEPPDGVILHGDSRCVWLSGDIAAARRLAEGLPVQWVDRHEMTEWWGPEPISDMAAARLPDAALLADAGVALHYPGNDVELVGYHGGLSEDELRIPLLVASSDEQ